MKRKTETLTLISLLLALIFVSTAYISIPIGVGYFNLGDAVIIFSATILGPLPSMLMAGLASSGADIVLGYGAYALATFIIKGLEGLSASLIFKLPLKSKILRNILLIIPILFMIGGYFVADYILFDRWLALSNLGGLNLWQGLVSYIISIILINAYQKIKQKKENH